MKRFYIFLLTIFLTIPAISAQSFYNTLEPNKNQIVVYVGAYDWGPCIEKVVINTGRNIEPEKINKEDFCLERQFYAREANLGMRNKELTIVDAFVSDAKGNKTDGSSKYITLLTDVYPTAENSSPFVGYIATTVFEKFYNYRVTNDELNLKISKVRGFVNPEASRFTANYFTCTAEGQPLEIPYLTYVPETKKAGTKIPMILWFHSIGESGSNPYLVLFGNKSCALADEKIQSYFENGVAILAPQCPTGWLETTEENSMGIRYWAPVDIDGTVKKVSDPVTNFIQKILPVNEKSTIEEYDERIPFAATSYYTQPITDLLMKFLDEHPQIDRDRVYVGGCSAGGYMTMNMMIQHSELFAAAFPTCEYYLDNKITNAQIDTLAKKPMWFTYAENDKTVNPKNNCIPTIKRLRQAGAKNLKVSVFPNVVDRTGNFPLNRDAEKGDDDYGLPYEYDGHYSWIYVLNDECTDGDDSLFKWLSRQRLNH